MDRGNFLRALPFLRQISSSSTWPPQPCSSGNNSRCEVFLANQLVSIEPASGVHSDETVGAAFFASTAMNDCYQTASEYKNHSSSDPAMCKIEAALVSTANAGTGAGVPSPAVSSASTTLSISQSPNHNKNSPSQKEFSVDLYLRFENILAFQVDCSQLKTVKINNTSTVNDDNNPNKKSLPPCLLLVFNACCFRIFSLSDSKSDEADNFVLLRAALEKITLARRSGGRGTILPLASAAIDSPRNSGHTTCGESSSHEAGQRESQGMKDDSPMPSNCQTQNKVTADSEKCGNKRRKPSFDNTWKRLKSLQSALDLPVSAFPEIATKGPSYYFAPLMNSIAEDLATSYESTADKAAEIGKQEHSIMQCQTKIDVILNDVLPAPRAKQRRGLNMNSPTKCPGHEEIEDLLKNAKALMKQQKKAVLARHTLALLP